DRRWASARFGRGRPGGRRLAPRLGARRAHPGDVRAARRGGAAHPRRPLACARRKWSHPRGTRGGAPGGGELAPAGARAPCPAPALVGVAVKRTLTAYRLGRVEYEDGLRLQAAFAEARRTGAVGDVILLLEHPPVLTLGRGGDRADIVKPAVELEARGVEVHETNRGGEVPSHGPAQIAGSPTLDLAPERKAVRRYVRSVEEGMIRALAMFGVTAGRIPKWPGVWLGTEAAGDARKIGAVGVHIARWITTHGFALNVGVDLRDFELLVPCGIEEAEAGVTSLERELGHEVALSPVEEAWARAYAEVWESELRWNEQRLRTVSVTAVRHTVRGPEVLLLRRTAERGGFWQPVTGRRAEGERADMAARRE